MKLVVEKRGPRDKYDHLKFVREDGSTTQCQLPRQGTLPHDLIHYIVEDSLPLNNGFLGLIASGSDADFVLKIVHDKLNPRVETEAVQVESIVEALQTQLWAGAFDVNSFLEGAELAASSRGKSAFSFRDLDPRMLYEHAMKLLNSWNSTPFYGKMELYFKAGEG
jgi:hypothetical protein